jgi:exosome complex component RRP4
LSGVYHPKRGDTIIGYVTEVLLSGWRIDTNSAYSAVLNMKDATSEFIARGANLTRYFAIGDYVMAKITNVTSQNLVDLTMKGPGLRKLRGGRIISVSPNKVPRIIGKQGSMVSMIKQYTNCRILVGQNGIVWIQGEDPAKELLSVETIKKIEKEAHVPGLTDNIKAFLEKHKDGIKEYHSEK